jgi:MYXO-CTERM domain-containing protein
VNGLCLCAGRDGGGCSTSDTGDSRQIFLALLLPAGLLLARRLRMARVKR